MQYYLQHLSAVFPSLLQGAVLTVEVTALSVFFGTIIGLFVGMGRLAKNKLAKTICAVYVDVIRGTPLLVQVFIIYFGVPNLVLQVTGNRFPIDPFIAAVLACSINSGAYVAEIFRAGIQSIERGQMEAARSLGMTNAQAMRYVILPQAFRRVVPPLGNEFIALMKDTSLLSAIGLEELVRKGQLYTATTFASFPVYTGVAIIYLIMTMTVSRWVAYTERRLSAGDHS
ncbi:amino acid ABC transporter permease [Zhaonella formicivorans]|uniref:amino acid ABC transporter permease n=1 Tax=Zhaonella formicivorans TaxID=2528593 RepID=UPI0010EF0DBC